MRGQNEVRNILRSRYLESSGYKNKEIKKMQLKNQVTGVMFTLAPVVVMTIFVFGTFLIGLILTMFKGKMTPDLSELEYIGIDKTWELLGKDRLLPTAIKHTFEYVGISLAFSVVSAVFMAFLLNSGKIYGKKAFLVMYFLPQITSASASTIIFYTLFQGPFNVDTNPDNKFLIIILSGLWIQVAGSIVIFNTAFANIGKTEYEAAKLDGASAWTRFWRITMPTLSPIIAYQFMMTMIVGMSAFGESYVMMTMGYATADQVVTWAALGFMHVAGEQKVGIPAHVGLGILEMALLASTVLVMSLVANFIQPINGRKRGK